MVHVVGVCFGLVAATALAGLIGGPLSGWIISGLDQVGGLAGWRWMFLLQGVPTVLCGIAALWLLPDGTRMATWLTRAEQDAVIANLGHDPHSAGHGRILREVLRPKVWVLCFAWFTLMCGAYVLSFWVPAPLYSLVENAARILVVNP